MGEALNIQVGDVVTLKPMLVATVSDSGITAYYTGEPSRYYLRSQVASVQPRLLKVEDRVTVTNNRAYNATIVAIDGHLAWLRCDEGSHFTRRLSDLTRL